MSSTSPPRRTPPGIRGTDPALTRAVASLGNVNLGHFLPDYTAYEELLDVFRWVTPIPILLSRENGYLFSSDDLRREVLGRGLGAILVSNPSNPMGKVIAGDALAAWVKAGREQGCTLLIDEFYSQYVWETPAAEPGPSISASRFVEDVDSPRPAARRLTPPTRGARACSRSLRDTSDGET